MTAELNALIFTAASIGFLHTILGPDHYLPFVMMSWSRQWSWFKTTWVTFLCGVGHIVGSVVLGFVGVKMLLTDVYKIPITTSLLVIAVILAVSVLASLLFPPTDVSEAEKTDVAL